LKKPFNSLLAVKTESPDISKLEHTLHFKLQAAHSYYLCYCTSVHNHPIKHACCIICERKDKDKILMDPHNSTHALAIEQILNVQHMQTVKVLV